MFLCFYRISLFKKQNIYLRIIPKSFIQWFKRNLLIIFHILRNKRLWRHLAAFTLNKLNFNANENRKRNSSPCYLKSIIFPLLLKIITNLHLKLYILKRFFLKIQMMNSLMCVDVCEQMLHFKLSLWNILRNILKSFFQFVFKCFSI